VAQDSAPTTNHGSTRALATVNQDWIVREIERVDRGHLSGTAIHGLFCEAHSKILSVETAKSNNGYDAGYIIHDIFRSCCF